MKKTIETRCKEINSRMTLSEFEKYSGLHFTVKHSGKMSGMISISTSVRANHFCECRAKNVGSICSHCFADAMMNQYGKSFEECFERNTEILTTKIFSINEMPILNVAFFRFESFGDLNNDIQVINYFNL